MTSDRRRKSRRTVGLPYAWISIGLLAVGCVSPPRAAGPTAFGGPVPGRAGAVATAEALPESTSGPLLLTDPEFAWLTPASGQYRWQVLARNPSQTEFRVTIVVRLLDATGTTVGHTESTLLLSGRHEQLVSGQDQVNTDDRATAVDWRVEYWVRLLPPPDRRVRRSGG